MRVNTAARIFFSSLAFLRVFFIYLKLIDVSVGKKLIRVYFFLNAANYVSASEHINTIFALSAFICFEILKHHADVLIFR